MPNKQILVENMCTDRFSTHRLILEKSKNPRCLGSLRGICADFINPTRNGRLYPRELWVKVLESDNFKEAMATKTCFGENDHPETRADTSIKEISVVLTELHINDKDGTVEGTFDIIDTPQGRILKALVDYGSQLGVSSRGLGDQVESSTGEIIIDPETYDFYAFDVVVQPAVMKARPDYSDESDKAVTENNTTSNKKIKTNSKAIRNLIKETNDIDTLNTIKRIVEASNLHDCDSILGSINHKLKSSKDGGELSSHLEKDLSLLAESNEKLRDDIEILESKIRAKNIRIKELTDSIRNSPNKRLTESYARDESFRDTISFLEKSNAHKTILIRELTALREKDNSLLKRHKSYMSQLETDMYALTDEIEDLKFNNNSLHEQLEESLLESSGHYDKLEKENLVLIERNNILEKKLQQLESLSSKHNEEKRSLADRNKSAARSLSEATLSYLDVKCSKHGLNKGNVVKLLPREYTISDIDRVVEELCDRSDRLNRVPIASDPTLFGYTPERYTKTVVVENLRSPESEESLRTAKFLEECVTRKH